MTGFGKAARQHNGQTISVELASVNHRFLDPSVRMPNEWAVLDPEIRDALREHVARGKITVNVNRKKGQVAASSVRFDAEVARQYIEAARAIGHLAGEYEKINVNTLAQLHGVFYFEDNDEEVDKVRGVVLDALRDAAQHLNAMRIEEGKALEAELRQRIENIRACLRNIEARLPELNRLYKERLQLRLQELGEDSNVTQDRLAMEVALMADKGDVTEETVRLKSHLDHAIVLLEAGGDAAGRKLNFLSQEMQREINTLGAKIRDSEISREVLEIKSEVEKIREQVQNVE